MALLLEGLDLLAPGGLPESGAPLRLPIATIDEDPDQPRQEFDDDSLAELAETIKERGVRQPVSVRAHPSEPGRWMLNFGARRLRASKLAGLSEIPAFVDQTANSVDQFIEN
jgi:ParB family chromosome partitioning protein